MTKLRRWFAEPVTTGTLIRACRAMVLLIVAQYALAFAWWKTHDSRSALQTAHPFTWDATANFTDLSFYTAKLGPGHLRQAYLAGGTWPVFNYAPSAALVYRFLLGYSHPVHIFLLIVVGSTLALLAYYTFYLWRCTEDRALKIAASAVAVTTVLLSFPMQYTLWRANLEGIAWVGFSWGLVAFVRKKYTLASCLWALGVCVKPFPVLLFLLLLRRRQWRSIVAGASLFLALQVVAVSLIAPTVQQAFRFMQQDFALYRKFYVNYFRFNEARFQHSLLDSMKASYAGLTHHPIDSGPLMVASPENQRLHLVWEGVVVICVLALLLRFWRKPQANVLFAIVGACLLLTPVSADYTTILMHLCCGVFLLWLVMDVARGRAALKTGQLYAFLLPFAVLFAAQNWLSFYAGILHTAALLAVVVAGALVDMPATLFGEVPAASS